ncbi:hypothetical protein J3459_018401 [Metarhizium acridum]|nr:hypothetical protein J3459_018401 [Metarhizium acridum]
MNTPPPGISLPELDIRKLNTRLRQLTPEIDFRIDTAHSNKWSAELAAHNLDAQVVYDARHSISDKDYWQVEALTLLEAYLRQSSQRDRSEAERWRNVCVGVEALLKEQGVDIDEHRQSIDNEGYWELEADCLKMHTARLESELLEGPQELGSTKATSQKLLSPGSEIGQGLQRLRRRKHRRIRPQQSSTKNPLGCVKAASLYR